MKRTLSIVLILCIVLSLAACGIRPNSNPSTPTGSAAASATEPTVLPTIPATPTSPTEPAVPPVDMSKVLAVDLGLMCIHELNRKNAISEKTKYFIADNVEKEKIFNLGGVNYDLTYKKSALFPIENRVCHQYVVNGDEDNTIVLDDKGNLVQILYAFAKLNISPKASAKEVLELLETELTKILDLSYYNEFTVPEAAQKEDGTFTFYDYKFLRIVDGYVQEYFVVSVDNSGNVRGLKISKYATVDFKLNIDEAKVNATIIAKLKEIYNTKTTQYLSYTPTYHPIIVQYNGKLYVRHRVEVAYSYTDPRPGQSVFEEAILIPLEEVNK